MEDYSVFQDIAERTGGDVYLGVVGPVRTGKSTFIKKFADLLVLPRITDEYIRERTKDELPQSGAGRTIMTVEPKFIPDEAVEIEVEDGLKVRIRLVDCVGYTVEGAQGYQDEDGPRMVMTPWFDYQVPLQEAAELGTNKVISDHATLGIIVTTDGSITDIPRENYVEAEERVVAELKELKKPFVIVLNSANPYNQATLDLCTELREKYDVPVINVNCAALNEDDIRNILQEALYEFPVREINVNLPKWIEKLSEDYWLKQQLEDGIRDAVGKIKRIRDINAVVSDLSNLDCVATVGLHKMDLGTGSATIEITADKDLFYKVLSDISGFNIEGEHNLIEMMKELSIAKRCYDKMAGALQAVQENGYGIVPPGLDDMTFQEPELYKKGGMFGVKLKASAPAIHMIKANVETEVTPFMGSARQSEDLIEYLTREFESNPEKLWETEFLGRSLYDLVRDGLQNKLHHMPENTQRKLQRTIQKISNEGSSNLICIIF